LQWASTSHDWQRPLPAQSGVRGSIARHCGSVAHAWQAPPAAQIGRVSSTLPQAVEGPAVHG
jgi:hypothetical protein